jgi:bis(5'-nucleosyl)-tetraphosphatase (symmetrical)
MDFKVKGEVTKAPKGYLPWFEVPGRKSADTTVVFGHWSALGLRDRAQACWRWIPAVCGGGS